MHFGRTVPLLASLLVLGCPDSGGGDGDEATTSTTAGTTTESSGDPTTTPTSSTTMADSTTTTTAPEESSSSSEGSESSSTGTPGDTVTLQNDGWTPQDSLTWQTWPSPGDCWASSYAIEASLYPFDIVGVEAAIGGADGTQTFEIGIWEVDGDGLPSQAIDTAEVEIEGNVQGPPIDIEGLLSIPTIEEGSFAVVMCHVDHMGTPSIGIDADGTVDGAHNFAYQELDGDWVPSPDFFGTPGDFIMRTIVRPI